MHSRLLVLLAALAATLVAALSAAASTPPPVDARAVIVVDGRSGDVLYEENADHRMAMASITKLMTAIVTLQHARPKEMVTVSPRAIGQGGSSVFLTAGEQLTVRELLAAALIQSANDAAYALAAHVGRGSIQRFVKLMNDEAAALGLEDTHYVRPDGLDAPGHYSSAEDVATLARIAMERPLIRRLVRTKTMEISGPRTLKNWNDLLWRVRGLVGVKTGHTDNAGWAQVAAAKRGPTSVYAVILGSPGRERRNVDLAELVEWGFDQYAIFTLVRPGERYASAAIPFEDDQRVGLVAAGGAGRVVRLGDGTRFVERVIAPSMVDLPIRKGQKLGEVVVMLDEREVARVDLVAERDVAAPTFSERAGWYADRALDEAGDMLGAVVPGL